MDGIECAMTERGSFNSQDTTIVESHDALDQLKSRLAGVAPALLCFGTDSDDAIMDLRPGEITLGRSQYNDLVIEAHSISRSHFRLTVSDDMETVVLEDLQSRNGTLLNDRRIVEPVKLAKDDVITAGNLVFKYLPKASPERQLYAQLQQKANTDGLTRCFNRQYLFEVLERELGKQRNGLNSLSLIVLDIDHFKDINDHHGHQAGDDVLRSLATLIWHNEIREIDLFARYGGEEFVIALFRTEPRETFAIAERIRMAIERHTFECAGQELKITASLGVAGSDGSVSDPKELFRHADAALYDSKKRGRNCTSLYSPEASEPR